ncbi:MAG: hypothetical protein IKY45_00150 [Clostridia bacterium]|nr:hypothetical protein [Clostridia bacterium]
MAQFNGSADNIENNKNKVISISKDSTHEQYPSAKATFEKLKDETAKFISLEDKTEWIFNGGNASGSVGVELVIDNEMSDESDNLVSNKIIKRYVDEKFLSFYPVGSIYMSMNDTSPAFLFGGEWERIEERFLLSCGDTYAAGSTGGKAKHTLTENEMPRHKGHLYDNGETGNWNNAGEPTYFLSSYSVTQHNTDRPFVVRNSNEAVMRGFSRGGNQPHENMPPYLAVHMWKRIA